MKEEEEEEEKRNIELVISKREWQKEKEEVKLSRELQKANGETGSEERIYIFVRNKQLKSRKLLSGNSARPSRN